MAGNHGGRREGAGRKSNAEVHALAIAAFTQRCADRLPEAFPKLWEPGAAGWRVETKRDFTRAGAVEVRASGTVALEKDGVGVVRFFARTLAATDESGTGRLQVRLAGRGAEPVLETRVSFGREWTEFIFPFQAKEPIGRGEATLSFGFGFLRQTVEIRDPEARYYGGAVAMADLPKTHFTYAGREADAPWRREALARIERVRKGDFSVRVVDPAGRPVAGAVIEVAERRSAFQWGSALQFARLVTPSPDNRAYRDKAKELFNAASPENDLKWVTWVGDWGPAYSPRQSIRGLRWLRDEGFHARGHVLVWPGRKNLPKAVQDLLGTPRQGEIPGMVRDHIREMARATDGLVEEWDTLNEPYTNHDLMDVFGRDIMVDWFRTAHEAMPRARLFYNDFSNHDLTTDADHVANTEANVQFLLDHGAPLGGLGIQSHIGEQPNAPAEVLKVLDRYDRFHLPIRVTEFDIQTTDEALQADYTRDFLTLMFSHPSVVGLQVWGFWEKAHWRPSAAMYRADWSEKPSGAAYRSLVLGQWRTRLKGVTGGDGTFGGRGFFGDYTAWVRKGDRWMSAPFAVRAEAPGSVVTLTLP